MMTSQTAEKVAPRPHVPPDQPPARWRRLIDEPNWATYLLSLLLALLLWQGVVSLFQPPALLLPGPAAVWRRFLAFLADGSLALHTGITMRAVLSGLFLGCLLAMPLGYLLAKSPLAERLLAPYLIASQAIPVIAIAPLLIIWIDSIFWNRTLVAALVVFFPILVNVVAGLRSVPPELYELMHSLRASRWQIFRQLELPAALPVLLAGLKVGATLSVIGALVGEWVKLQNQGLAFLIERSRRTFATDGVFAVIITLAVLALAMYGTVVLLERRWLRWQQQR